VRALPLLLALASAMIMAPPALSALGDTGHTRANHRGHELPFPFGVLVVAAAAVALTPLVLIERLTEVNVIYPQLLPIAAYTLGVACLGLIDDVCGGAGPGAAPVRGWRGHGRAVLRGEPSTGALKAAGSLGLALAVMNFAQRSTGDWLLASALLVLATNLFNLLDLRPGRSTKVFVLLGLGLLVGSADLTPLWMLGLFVGPALIAGLYDLRERSMLGDTGANVLGALAGLWMVLTLSGTGQEIALALLVALTVYGEFRSISALVERTPGLRGLDSLGRPS
jgi:UDP-GlcNAc:undecaprenyl-phosphate GlcNAc-1-phosphate transferase